MRVSDAVYLPFDVRHNSDQINEHFQEFTKRWGDIMKKNNISLNHVKEALKQFIQATREFEEERRQSGINCNGVRVINDQILKLQHAFLVDDGHTYNTIFGPRREVSYSGDWFPAIVSALVDSKTSNNIEEVKRQVSLVYKAIRSTTRHLEVVKFLK